MSNLGKYQRHSGVAQIVMPQQVYLQTTYSSKGQRPTRRFLRCLAGGRCIFTAYLWGKPLAPGETEGNSGRGQNSPIDKPQKRPAREPRYRRKCLVAVP
jgi:hypothetical protein